MVWTDRMLGTTRAQLLALLRRRSRSIGELAPVLGISNNAVRAHVAAMQRDGLVEPVGVERTTGGKPAQLYGITAAAEEMFPKAYSFVLRSLLSVLTERGGQDSVVEMLREVGMRAAPREPDGTSAAERTTAAAEALRRLGAEVEVERAERGWLIRGYACPLASVVQEHSEVCALAESLVATITGLAVTERCDRGDRPRCAFEVIEAASQR